MLLGVVYAVLAAARNRWCWLAGAMSSAIFAYLAAIKQLPMQAGLQAIYVLMAGYGWWSWRRQAGGAELPVGRWPIRAHLLAALAMTGLSFASAHLLVQESQAAWPLLDSLTTWFSLLATWLVARARLENWLYWIVIDGVLVYLCYVQDLYYISLLMLLYMGIATAGFIAWRRKLHSQAVSA